MAFSLLPVMDYFIQTCNCTVFLMDSSHCCGKVTIAFPGSPINLSHVNGAIVQNSPLNLATLTTMEVSERHVPDSSKEAKEMECFFNRILELMGVFLIL